MNPYTTWIDVKTLAEIKKVTPRAVRLSLPKSGYSFREVNSSGGKSYEILLSSLEPKLQDIYRDRYYKKVVELEAQIDSIPAVKQIQTQSGFIPETAKTIALARIDLIKEWQRFRNNHKPRHKGDKLFLDLYNSGEYLKNVFAIIGKTSRGSLHRWHRSYSEHESWEVLVPQYNYTSFNEYRTILTEEEMGIFLNSGMLVCIQKEALRPNFSL
jgi:hypothetical protein